MSAERAGTNQANNCPDSLRLETHNVKQRLRIAIVSLTHTIRSLGFSADVSHGKDDLLGSFHNACSEWSCSPANPCLAATAGESDRCAAVRLAVVPPIGGPGSDSAPVARALCGCPVFRPEYHANVAPVCAFRQRVDDPPAARVQGWHQLHRERLLARRRSAPLYDS